MQNNKDFILGAVNKLPLEPGFHGYKVLLLDWHPMDRNNDGRMYDEASMLNALRSWSNKHGHFTVEVPPYTEMDIKCPTHVDQRYVAGTVKLDRIERTEEGRIQVHGFLKLAGVGADVLKDALAGEFILTPSVLGIERTFEGKRFFTVGDVFSFRFHFHGEWKRATKLYTDHGHAYWEIPELCWKVWEESGVVVQRTIVAAAFRATLKDGSKLTVPCARHGTPDAHALFGALRDGDVLKNDHAIGEDQGFIDQFGEYHNREDAFVIATHAKQLVGREKTGSRENTLYSEDLY